MTTILVTEDDEMIRDVLARRLQRAGFEVSLAEDGASALQQLEGNQFDLVLLDIMMPGIDGYEVLQRIKQHDTWRSIPVIMLTAVQDKLQVVKCLKMGADNYVVKPFDMDELKDRISESLAKSGKQGPVPQDGRSAGVASNTASATRTKAGNSDKQGSIIEELVGRLKQGDIKFPVLPVVAFKLVDMLESEDVTLNDLSNLIKADPAVSAILIRVVNSGLFMMTAPVTQVDKALSHIGLKNITQHLVPAVTSSLFNVESPLLESILGREWKHSQACAVYAKQLGRAINHPKIELLFMLGLFHDIGKMFILSVMQDIAKERPLGSAVELEELLDKLHTKFGEALMKRWKLPLEFAVVAGQHHLDRGDANHSREAYVINLADNLADWCKSDDFKADEIPAEIVTQLKHFDLNSTQLAAILAQSGRELADGEAAINKSAS